jgi:hypothetical protein
MLNVIYVANKPIMLGVVMLNIVIMSVIRLSVIMLNAVIMSVIMLSVVAPDCEPWVIRSRYLV